MLPADKVDVVLKEVGDGLEWGTIQLCYFHVHAKQYISILYNRVE